MVGIFGLLDNYYTDIKESIEMQKKGEKPDKNHKFLMGKTISPSSESESVSSTSNVSAVLLLSAKRMTQEYKQRHPNIGSRARLKQVRIQSPKKRSNVDQDTPERRVFWNSPVKPTHREMLETASQIKRQKAEKLDESKKMLREILTLYQKANYDATTEVSNIVAFSQALLPESINPELDTLATAPSLITDELLGLLSLNSLLQLFKSVDTKLKTLAELLARFDMEMIRQIEDNELRKIFEDTLKSVISDIDVDVQHHSLILASIKSYQQNVKRFLDYFNLAYDGNNNYVNIVAKLSDFLGAQYPKQYLQEHPTLVRILVEQASTSINLFSKVPSRVSRFRQSEVLREELITDARYYEQAFAQQEKSLVNSMR